MILLDGRSIAEKRNNELKLKIDELKESGIRVPTLAIIQVGNDAASNSYIKGKIKAAKKVGMIPLHFHFEDHISEKELEEAILNINQDNNIDGVILQLPLPNHLNEAKLTNLIKIDKDVDGFHILNKGLLFEGKPGIRPATPQGIITLLNEYEIDVKGLNAVVVGRSNIVGVPISKMLLDLNATVTICHSKTKNLSDITSKADVLIVAIGKPHFITNNMVKNNAIVIDVGVNRVNDKLIGDVDFENVKEKVSYITPVPKGVGPMTISALLENTYKVFLKKNKEV
ncbi:bifunctional 5,10-methylenetetrahydrofolate dehydrogenase/5,10-methenyltetrahydrofolate cyclohydrolase [Acholeplasma sp. OttesenSCG-928-E16]|nr:bifunctional 5,10-methylenetetrahydrofolate dehydrogenase/5,10-methenyltetrahydrofolate cyclohydrolase [Acholeplasma sp. OttesenSCG-928-E16]